MTCLVVISARWGSTRLPGKPTIQIAGKPLLERVIALARRATRGMSDVQLEVATDDERIASLAHACGCPVSITDAIITSGSGRALAAARRHHPYPDHVVNLQGDAPFIPPDALRKVIDCLEAGAAVATPVTRLSWPALDELRRQKKTTPFSGTTCVTERDGTARWFSKQVIPALRDEIRLRREMSTSPILRHLGLYGYRLESLEQFERAALGEYEQFEGLEQLRFFDLGIPIQTVEVAPATISMGGIDAPEDIALAEQLIRRHGEPM